MPLTGDQKQEYLGTLGQKRDEVRKLRNAKCHADVKNTVEQFFKSELYTLFTNGHDESIKNDPDIRKRLGWLHYYYGSALFNISGSSNLQTAIRYFRKSVEDDGLPDATYFLGIIYFYERYGVVDWDLAKNYLQQYIAFFDSLLAAATNQDEANKIPCGRYIEAYLCLSDITILKIMLDNPAEIEATFFTSFEQELSLLDREIPRYQLSDVKGAVVFRDRYQTLKEQYEKIKSDYASRNQSKSGDDSAFPAMSQNRYSLFTHDQSVALYQHAKSLFDQKKLAEALNDINRALVGSDRRSWYDQAQFLKAKILLKLNPDQNREEAMQILEKVISEYHAEYFWAANLSLITAAIARSDSQKESAMSSLDDAVSGDLIGEARKLITENYIKLTEDRSTFSPLIQYIGGAYYYSQKNYAEAAKNLELAMKSKEAESKPWYKNAKLLLDAAVGWALLRVPTI